MSRPSRLAAAGVAVLVATGALSGCGVSDAEIRPGLAAEVGEVQITVDELDEAVDGACVYFKTQGALAREQDPTLPESRQARGDVRSQLLQLLVQRAVAEQVLEDNDAELDPSYATTLAQAETGLAAVPAGPQRDGVTRGNEAAVYAQAALAGVGAELLADEGVTGVDEEAVVARGNRAFTDWIVANDIDINPMFAVRVVDGVVKLEPATATSVAASSFSITGEAAAAASTDGVGGPAILEYAESLPADQTCG